MFISIKQHAHVHIIILFNLKRKKKENTKKNKLVVHCQIKGETNTK